MSTGVKSLRFRDGNLPHLQFQLFSVVFPTVTNILAVYITQLSEPVDQSCCPTLCVFIFNMERWVNSTK